MSNHQQIEMQIHRHPSGNLTLMERHDRASMWADVMFPNILRNDSASFYREVARRLANYAMNGIPVVSYKD